MAPLDHITATFKVVTPMFLGDARQEATRFSLASFKGALRFWWRAVAWAEVVRAAEGDRGRALGALAARERLLFGAAAEAGRQGVGQSHVLLRLRNQELGLPLERGARLEDGRGRLVEIGARYLGYGLVGAFGPGGGKLQRSCFPAGRNVTVEIALRPSVRHGFRSESKWREACGALEQDRVGLDRALRALGLLGGLGARTRRGWGSLTLVALTGGTSTFERPQNSQDYGARILELMNELGALPEALPPHTALSGKSRIEVVHEDVDPLAVLDHVGRQMQRYRAWGFRGKVDGRPSEENFRRDHDWSKAPWQREFAGYVPRRAAFGLPHNYGRGTGVKPAAGAAGDRRASPLLIHVHALGNGRHAALLILLPARFLPGDQVALTWARQSGPVTARMPQDWADVLHGFFDGPPKAKERGLPPYFPEKKKVLPREESVLP